MPRQWQHRQDTGSPRASDASPRRLGRAVLAACGRLSRSVGLMCSPSQHPRQAGRSDLCSHHQRGSAGRSAWCVNRVTQPCRISQVCRQSARDAGLVALAAAHASPDLSLNVFASIQRLLGYAAWLCFSQIASQQLKWQQCTPASKSSRLDPVVCDCALTGNVPSTRAG